MTRMSMTMNMSVIRALAATTAFLFSLLVFVCRIDEVSGQNNNNQPSSSISSSISSSSSPSLIVYNQREFADDVLRSLYDANDNDGSENGNECSSMLGLSMVFGLLYPSAVGESLTEMQQVFGFPQQSNSNIQQRLVWSDTQKSLQERLNGNCSSHSSAAVLDMDYQNQEQQQQQQQQMETVCLQGEPLLTIANVVWVPRSLNNSGGDGGGLNETYQRAVGNLLQEMNFDAANAGRRVNRWVNDATNGLIPSIVMDGPLSDVAALLAVNTIYLKAQWAKPFESSYTNMDHFYTTASRTTTTTTTSPAAANAHFMHQVDFFDYSESALAGYQLVKMPFSQSGNQGYRPLSMVFALPLNEEGGMIIPSTALLWNAMPQLERTRVALALPKFRFESRYGSILKQTLQNLGLRAPFNKGDLCIQNNSCNGPRLGRVLQKTVISLDELGVEAAAASAVFGAISLPTEQPVLFQADHPFYFFILDETAEVIIFEGRVGDPGIVNDAPAPQLAAVHQEDGFWTSTFPALLDPPRQPGIPSILGPLAMQDLGELPPPTILSTDLTSNQRTFADDLLSRIYTNDNECSSALGISMAHSLVYPAAIGDSLAQMAATLRYPPSETNLQLLWSDTQSSLQATFDGACRGYEDVDETICASNSPLVKIGNAVFVPSLAGGLNSTYEQVVGDFVFEIDFEADDAGSLVNAWVNASTNGLIDSIVDDGPLSPLVLLAINTIYFKAFWAVPFSKSDTNEDAFYTSIARSEMVSSAHFMHQVGYFEYSHAAFPGYQLLGQPFNDDGLSMYFALPMSSDVPVMASDDLFGAIPRLNLTRVAIALPKFQYESEYEEILMESLKAMGMQSPFLGDLCIQNDGSCDVSISRVAQKTLIDLREDGVAAAAVSSLSGITSMPQDDTVVLFQADHPFQFFIYDETHQVVIFEGRVGDPAVVDGAETPQLTATHDDADFWANNFGVDPSLPSPPEVLEQPSFTTNASSIELISNQRVFADDLVPLIYTNDNECSSALGISMVHSLVYPSAIDQSLVDMATTLGYPQSQTNLQLLWNATQNRIQEAYKGDCIWYMDEEQAICGANASIVNIGNAVFVPSQAGLNSTYEQVVGDYVLEIDFDADDAGSLVNEWVSTATNGLIESIVEDGPLSPLVLLAVNTIYLKGSWQNTFSPSATNEDTFYMSVARSEALDMAHFMHQVDYFDYSDTANPDFQLLKQPFNDERLSMFFALPIGENASMMSSEDFVAALPQLSRTRMAIALPKFQFESEYEDILMESLQAMGMQAPFIGGLCIQDGACDFYISLVIQKTFIDANEDGVVAAAASVVGTERSKPTDTPVLFQADHPFQFFIYDGIEQVVIFEGRVGNPGIVDGAATPQLTARHDDADFWSSNFAVGLSGDSTAFDPPVSIITDMTSNQLAFADDLVPRIYTNDNECSSALGISMAHSLVYPAAIDQSLIDMTTTLRYPPSETNLQLLWNNTQQQIQNTYNGECNMYEDVDETICYSSSPLVTISNAVFVPNQGGLNSTYEQVVGSYVMEIDFEADDAGSLVNAWVNSSTNGLIDSIVDDGPLSPLVLLAINVIYLKAQWAAPFMISSTNEDTFYTSVARTEAVSSSHFMHQVDYFDYSHDAIPDYQVLRQPFTEKGLSMYFALPMTNSDVPMMLTSDDMFVALSQLNQTRVAIALPKFQFESEYEEILMESLQDMGMLAPFLGGLCIQTGSCETSISRVAQKTFIDLREEGVIAAAVTLVAGTTSAPTETPVLFQADHPFQFFIYDEDEQVFIFEGRVGDPGVVDGAATPQLTATHDDADFWTNNFGVEPSPPVVSAPPEVLEQPSTNATNTTITTPDDDDEETPPTEITDDDSNNSTDGQPNAPDEQTSSSAAAVDISKFQTMTRALSVVASFLVGYWWLA